MPWECIQAPIARPAALWACVLPMLLLWAPLATGETKLVIANVTTDICALSPLQGTHTVQVWFEIGGGNKVSQAINITTTTSSSNKTTLDLLGWNPPLTLTLEGPFNETAYFSAGILINRTEWESARGRLSETLCSAAASAATSGMRSYTNYTLDLSSNSTACNATLPLSFDFDFQDAVISTTTTAAATATQPAPNATSASTVAASTSGTQGGGAGSAGSGTGVLVGGIVGGFLVGCLVLAVGGLVARRQLRSHRSHVVTKVFGEDNAATTMQHNPMFHSGPDSGSGSGRDRAANGQHPAAGAAAANMAGALPQQRIPHSTEEGEDAYANGDRLKAVWALLEDGGHQPACTPINTSTANHRLPSPTASSSSRRGVERARSESPHQRRQRHVSTESRDSAGSSTGAGHRTGVDFMRHSSDVERAMRGPLPVSDDEGGGGGGYDEVRMGRSLRHSTSSSGAGAVVYDDVPTTGNAVCDVDPSLSEDDERYDERPTPGRQPTSADKWRPTWAADKDGYNVLRRGPRSAVTLRTAPLRARSHGEDTVIGGRASTAAPRKKGGSGRAGDSNQRRSLYDVPRVKTDTTRVSASGSAAQQNGSYDVPRVQPPPRPRSTASDSDEEGRYRVPRRILGARASPALPACSPTRSGAGRHGSATSSSSTEGGACQNDERPPQLPPKTRGTVAAHASTPLRTTTTTAATAATTATTGNRGAAMAARSRGRVAHGSQRPQTATDAAAAVSERIRRSSVAVNAANSPHTAVPPPPRATSAAPSSSSFSSSPFSSSRSARS